MLSTRFLQEWLLGLVPSAAGSPGSPVEGGVGPKGDKGDKGDPGKEGPEGPRGPEGRPGTNGAPGTNGTDGANGTNGTNGRDGRDGDPFVVAAFEYSFADASLVWHLGAVKAVELSSAPGHVWFTFDGFDNDARYLFKGVSATRFGDVTHTVEVVERFNRDGSEDDKVRNAVDTEGLELREGLVVRALGTNRESVPPRFWLEVADYSRVAEVVL